MGHSRPLSNLFSSFQTIITTFTTNTCDKCPSSLRCQYSNPWGTEHESPPIPLDQGSQGQCFLLKKWAIPVLFSLFLSFQYSDDSKPIFNINKFLPMTGFESRTFIIGSNRSTNWATQPLPGSMFILAAMIICYYVTRMDYCFWVSDLIQFDQWAVWPLLKFCTLAKFFKYLVIFRVYFVFGRFLNLLWEFFGLWAYFYYNQCPNIGK